MSDWVQTHLPCEDCGSSDARSVNAEGWSTCFSCGRRRGPDGAQEGQEAVLSTSGTRALVVRHVPLPDRGIRKETARLFGVGLTELPSGEVVLAAPYHDASGAVVGHKLRWPDKRFRAEGNLRDARLFGEHLWAGKGRMVVVTEGELDALAASQAQGNRWAVVSVPSGAAGAAAAVRRSLDWLCGFERVVLAFDMDEPGQAAAVECAQLLPPGRAFIASLPRKDACDCLKDGLENELRSAFWNARPWRPDGILDGTEAWARAEAQAAAVGVPWGFPDLDRRTGGLRPGELAVVTGGTGAGKTTFVQQVLSGWLRDGVRCGLLALEAPLRRVVLDLCSLARGVPRQEELTPENRAAWDELAPNLELYQHFGSTQAENILSRMRYMARALGCRVLILDHLSIVVSGFALESDERRAIDQTLTSLATLAQEVEVGIVVVSHLRRPKEGAHEEGGRVTLAHLRGSGAIGQLAHTVVAVERDQQGGKRDCALRLLKCRHTGDLGPADALRYDPATSRLLSGAAAEYGFEGAA